MKATFIATLLIALGAVACNQDKKDDSASAIEPIGAKTEEAEPAKAAAPAPAAAAPTQSADDVYKSTCTVCHGESGQGDGPGAAALVPKPRNFGDATWQGGVTDEQIKKTIVGGGMAVGKSPLMPGNPGLKGNDAVLDGLVKKIRSFKK